MLYFLAAIICFFSSVIGSICGVGGGIIIKPVLDSLGIMNAAQVSFLSSMTVLSMSAYNTAANLAVQHRKEKNSWPETADGFSGFDRETDIPIAVGAASGGIAGKLLFQLIQSNSGKTETVRIVQTTVLLILVAITLALYIRKKYLSTYRISNSAACAAVGLSLGIMASFLGIGGGPFNLIVLYIVFTMDTKRSVRVSLLIILFSQIANLIYSAISGSIPDISVFMLILMIACGITGGIAGKKINGKLDSHKVDILFMVLLAVIIIICIYNICKSICNYSEPH